MKNRMVFKQQARVLKALALRLAGPALSLPSLLVIYKIIGIRKTIVFSVLTVLMSTLVGYAFGAFA